MATSNLMFARRVLDRSFREASVGTGDKKAVEVDWYSERQLVLHQFRNVFIVLHPQHKLTTLYFESRHFPPGNEVAIE
jgi:hypothetical protein